MSIGSINSQISIENLNNLSEAQGTYKSHTISLGDPAIISNSPNMHEFPTTPLANRQVTIPQ